MIALHVLQYVAALHQPRAAARDRVVDHHVAHRAHLVIEAQCRLAAPLPLQLQLRALLLRRGGGLLSATPSLTDGGREDNNNNNGQQQLTTAHLDLDELFLRFLCLGASLCALCSALCALRLLRAPLITASDFRRDFIRDARLK